MSADNFIAILGIGEKYIGYTCSASMCYPLRKCYECIGGRAFIVDTMEEAIIECENFSYLEYGYSFIDLKGQEDMEGIDCSKCFQNPTLPREGSKKAKAMGCTCTYYKGGMIKMGQDCPVHWSIEFRKSLGLKEES